MAKNNLLRHFFGGFVRLHLLHHASIEAICGVEMMEELQRHGYRLGPGTMYPILHELCEGGFLRVSEEVRNGRRRKNYRITKKGERLLVDAQHKLRELVDEVLPKKKPTKSSTSRRK